MVYLWSKINQSVLACLDRCLLCQRPGRRLCVDCSRDLPWNDQACQHCALPLPHAEPLCGQCLNQPPPYRALSVFRYAFPADRLLARLKYHGRLEPGQVLGGLLADVVTAGNDAIPDLLLPVPLHPERLRERGFNQAVELARPLAKALGLPLELQLLARHQHTRMQKSLNARERHANLRHAFRLDSSRYEALGQPRSVAIIDDVLTTGATASAISRLLLQAGVTDIRVWTLARTP